MFQFERHRIGQQDFLAEAFCLLCILVVIGCGITFLTSLISRFGILCCLSVLLIPVVGILTLSLTWESLVGIVEELPLRVEFFEVDISVEIDGSLCSGYVSKRTSIFQFRSTFPSIVRTIRTVCRHIIEGRYLVQRNSIGGVESRVVGERATKRPETSLYGVFPGWIVVGIEILIHHPIGLFDFGMSGWGEGHLQTLEDIPTER